MVGWARDRLRRPVCLHTRPNAPKVRADRAPAPGLATLPYRCAVCCGLWIATALSKPPRAAVRPQHRSSDPAGARTAAAGEICSFFFFIIRETYKLRDI